MDNLIRARFGMAAAALMLSIAGQASASLVIAGSSSGWGSPGLKSASVTFDVSGSDLLVTLTNTASTDVLVPADVLTAVFFDISTPALSLSSTSAVLDGGSSVFYDPDGQPAGGVVGGEWAFKTGITTGPTGASYGISSTGIGIFGPGDRFPGPDLSPPSNPDGLQYGLLSAGDDTATGNGGITGSGGLIKNSVKFTLGGLPTDFDLGRIGSVYFLYGTAIGEGGFEVPSPGTVALIGVAGVVAARRRRN